MTKTRTGAEFMDVKLSGATRLNIIIGDPIAQAKSPGGMTSSFAARGKDAILVPVQVAPEGLEALLNTCDTIKNLDSIVVTVPHKFASFGHCAATTGRAAFVRSVNVMRRRPEGGWVGDMMDGVAFLGAARKAGLDPMGKSALLVGAGGAGSAIALAFLDAGVRELAIHDADTARRDALVHRLSSLGKGKVRAGSDDPTGFDIAANATPMGMTAGDPLPIDASKLSPETHVGCVITEPAISPLIAAARARGCPTSTGTDMYLTQQEKLVDFLLGIDSAD